MPEAAKSRSAPAGPCVVFGGLGLVGQALLASRGDGQVVALGREDVDITEPDAIAGCLDRLRPAAAVNCAVFQPVDRCEGEPERAFEVNAVAAGRLARACAQRGIRLVHLSTDYVFDGRRRAPYTEEDPPHPLNVYGASKLAGELLVLAAAAGHLVVRTSAVFGSRAAGRGNPSFVERMLQRARAGKPTRVVGDQVVSPTYAAHLAEAIWTLLGLGEAGVVHVANGGACSWFELAREVFAAAGRPELLEATTAEFGAAARRPPYSVLDTARLRRLGLGELPHWKEALAAYLAAAHPEMGPRR